MITFPQWSLAIYLWTMMQQSFRKLILWVRCKSIWICPIDADCVWTHDTSCPNGIRIRIWLRNTGVLHYVLVITQVCQLIGVDKISIVGAAGIWILRSSGPGPMDRNSSEFWSNGSEVFRVQVRRDLNSWNSNFDQQRLESTYGGGTYVLAAWFWYGW